jgi:hypothetical protein
VSGVLVLVHGSFQDVLYFSVSKYDFPLEFGYICSEVAWLQIFTVSVPLVDHTTKVQGVPKLVVQN